MKNYCYNIYVHIMGEVEAESDNPWDILDAVFPDGWDGEVLGVSTEPGGSSGHIKLSDDQPDEDDEDIES